LIHRVLAFRLGDPPSDLFDEVQRRFAVSVHANTIGVWLRDRKLTRLQPRPFHPKKNLRLGRH